MTTLLRKILNLVITLTSMPAWAAADPYQEQLMQQLILAQPGDIIEIPAGHHRFDAALSLMVDEVTLKGQGPDTTVLDFSAQESGAEGLLVTSNSIILEDFSIIDTKGDAIKAISVRDLTMRNIHVRWSGEPRSSNGGYGLYPVKSENVLIEGCDVSGASDAGVYVGQSRNVIVRNNVAHANVAGIEIENTIGADVYDNYAYDNTAGMLVFNLPDLGQQGYRTRIFHNVLVDNNRGNFAPAINVVADAPRGTGLMLLAAKQIEIFDNFISNNDTTNLLLVHYGITGRPVQDPAYDPYSEGIMIHDNRILRAGREPQGGSSEMSQRTVTALREILPTPFPDLVYDGAFNPVFGEPSGIPSDRRICVREDKTLRVVNLDLPHDGQGMTTAMEPFLCDLPRLPAVLMRGVQP